jgi:hypothetical protein
MVFGKANRRQMLGDVPKPQRLGVLHEHPEQALALREVPDLGDHVGVHADVDEPHELAAADHAERGITGVDQLPRRLHDVAQHRVQLLGASHRQVGVQQPPVPALGVLHVLRPLHQLFEQLLLPGR